MKQSKTLSSGFSVEETIESLRQQLKDVTDHYHAALEAEQVRFQQLAASQAREQQLREVLDTLARLGNGILYGNSEGNWIAQRALALPQDTTALSAIVAKAGEVATQKAMQACADLGAKGIDYFSYASFITAIRALPGVTLEDLSK